KDEENRIIPVSTMEKEGLRIKVRGADKDGFGNISFREGILHIDSLKIKDAEIGIPHLRSEGMVTSPILYIKEDYEKDFRKALPYEKGGKWFNKVSVDGDHYAFNVEHFTDYYINSSGDFSYLSACLKTINNTADTCYITGADTIYSINKWLINSTDLNRSGLAVAFDFDVNHTAENISNDDSDNEHNATVFNSALWNATSYYGGGFDFNGTNFINASDFTWSANSLVTVSLWIKSIGTAGVGSAFGVGTSSDNRFQAHIPDNTHTFYWDYGTDWGTGRINFDYTPYEGKWTHVVLINSATELPSTNAVYINGVLKASNEGGHSIPALTGLTIGAAYLDIAGGYFYQTASIDQFRIWNRTLSKDEIEQLFAGDVAKYNLSGDGIVFTNSTYTGKTYDHLASYSPQNYTITDGTNVNFSTCVQFRDSTAGSIVSVTANETLITHATGSNNYSLMLYSEDDTAVLGCGAYANITLFIDRNYAIDCPTLEGAYGGKCWLDWDNAFNGTGTTSNYTWDALVNSTTIKDIGINPPYLRANETTSTAFRTGNNTLYLNGSTLVGNKANGIYTGGVVINNNNNTIQDLNLEDWYVGVITTYGHQNLITELNITNSTYGVIFTTAYNTLANTTFNYTDKPIHINASIGYNNITGNTFYNSTENINAINITDSNNNTIWLNSIYFGNISDNVNANNSYCFNGEGNFYKEGLVPMPSDCGQANVTRPAANTNYSAFINATWHNQSSARNLSYYLLYSKDSGSTWNLISRVYDASFYNWSIANLTFNSSYNLKVVPFDDNYNATERNVTFGIEDSAPTISSAFLNATSFDNLTSDNLTAVGLGVTDPEGDNVELNYNWYRNGVSEMALNMPMTTPDAYNRTYDFSGSNNHGNITSAVWNATEGKTRGSYDFDGSASYINISKVYTGSNYTIELWVKPREIEDAWAFMLGDSYTNVDTFGTIYSYINNIEYWQNGALQTSAAALTAGVWTHLVFLYNGTEGMFYVNGALTGTPASFTSLINNDLILGYANNDDGSYKFNGTVDELRVYNRSLSANEIKLLYENRTNVTHADATAAGENWTVKVTPIDSYGLNGTSVFSNGVNITQMFMSLVNQTVSNIPTQIVNGTQPINPNQNLTIRFNVSAVGGGLQNVWIKAWQTIKSAGNILWQGLMSLIGGVWTVDVPVNWSYPTGTNLTINYTIYANLTGGNVTQIEGNFSINAPPAISSTILNSTSIYNYTNDNLTATSIATDPDGDNVELNYNWYKNGVSDTILNMPMTAPDSLNMTYDVSGRGNHGNLSGAAWNRTGGYNGFGAYEFDGGGDFINITNNDMNFAGEGSSFTLSAWTKRAEAGTYDMVIAYGSAAVNQAIIFFYKDADTFSFDFYGNPLTTSSAYTDVGEWHQWVATYDGSTNNRKIYRDGVEVADDSSAADSSASGEMLIGFTPLSPIYNFNGTIDDVRIWNRTLSANEIRLLYENKTNVTHFDATTKHDNWTVKVTPIDSLGLNGTSMFSNFVNITNTPPPNITLLSPANNNLTLFNRTVTFNWTAATDDDGDSLTYILNITHATCPNKLVTGITGIGYLWTDNACLDSAYNWTVYASDGETNSTGRNIWGFKVSSMLIMTLVNSTVNFSNVVLNNEYNTSYDGAPDPLVLQNDGNVEADLVTFSANKGIWRDVGLNTDYFQYKSNNRTTETGSFNWSGSQTAWANVTNTSIMNSSVISQLNWTDSNDTAEIDVRIKVPAAEPAGAKFTNVFITGAMTG
ncbi:hypothetical protein COV19_07035, partial [Candidatus Woesearchaeota archaeon CG10_big_fil_rev_8_21_14_0_10_44_13]